MNRARLIVLISLAAIVVGVFLAVLFHEPAHVPVNLGKEEPPLGENDQPGARGITYTHVENGIQKWTLKAETATYDEGRNIVGLTQVRVDFYPEKGGKITITSDFGEYWQEVKAIILVGNVKVRTDDGKTLDTDRLTYSEKDKILNTEDWVLVTGKTFKILSKGMRVYVNDNLLIFKQEVDSTFIPDGSGPPPGRVAE